MTVRRTFLILGFFVILALTLSLFSRRGSVSVRLLRYEKVGREWYAHLELRNDTANGISYQSEGPAHTYYVWSTTNQPPGQARIGF